MRQSAPRMVVTDEIPAITMKFFAINTIQNGEQGNLQVFTDHRKAEASFVSAVNRVTNNNFAGFDEANRYYQAYRGVQSGGRSNAVLYYTGDVSMPSSRLALNGILLTN